MRYAAAEKLEIIRLVEQSALPVRRTLDKIGIPRALFTAGTICIGPVGRRLWTTELPGRIASGTAFQTTSASGSFGWHWTSQRCRPGNWPCASPTATAILSRREGVRKDV